MTGHVYPQSEWFKARAARARAGKAPRLAVIRVILLRQRTDGRWGVMLYERRYGKWSKPEWLCPMTSYGEARAATMKAWRKYRLPIAWAERNDTLLHPFRFGDSEPREATV